MMRLGVPMVALALALAGCGDGEEAATADDRLQIVLWSEGVDSGEPRRWDLRCDPAGGSLPHPAAACAALSALDDPWAPVPAGTSCAQVFLGPQVLEITGRLAGEPVSARFTRSDSCEDERFGRVAAALGLPEPA